MSFLIRLVFLLLKIPYRICESAYGALSSFFVSKKSVSDEIVLVTGAGHGIGRELTLQYAHLGATVVCLDINQQTNENVAEEATKATGRPVYAYRCDITDNAQVLEVAQQIRKEVGEVTVLINNAGIMNCRFFMDLTIDQIKSEFNVNILSHFWMVQAFLPDMIKNNHGHVVAISSIAGLVGFPNLTAYSATKSAIRGFMTALREELRITTEGKSLIKFTTIFPNIVDTGLCKKLRLTNPIVSLVPPEKAAAEIISAQRRDITERSIPSYWLPLINIVHATSKNMQEDVRDFIDCAVEPEN
ncbi:epidermal retinol dehydrogenase 2 [Harpegnathos saltator]|uniref:epidermal retinol dehydrogenase 2 n=1 Tax=Harpegnathos saltator TaxID=610380 RepID=UPI00058F5477|nr:epidermal retinol dehydrogenase 2 [Harpegnathos saltator]